MNFKTKHIRISPRKEGQGGGGPRKRRIRMESPQEEGTLRFL